MPGPNRLVHLSEPLAVPLHLSGSPLVTLQARVDGVDTNFAAILVDYGTGTRVGTAGDGIRTLGAATADCWGLASATDDACYRQTEKTLTTLPQEMVTHGIVDGLNLTDITTADPAGAGRADPVDIPLLPEDYVFAAGHRIGVVVLGSYSGYPSVGEQNRATITVRYPQSRVVLPVVGGRNAARAAGLG